MLIVISPAKNLDYDSPLPKVRATQPQMLEHSEQLIKDLKKLSPHDVSALMGISDKLGVLNYDRFQAWSQPFTKSNARPAVLSFNGEVYQGLEAQNFSDEDFKFAQDHLRILSGLYGVLRPLDLMQAYRLEMGTKFKNQGGSNLYEFWGTSLAEALNKQAKKVKSDTLINLASNEYFKAVDKKALALDVIEPVFKDYKNGNYKIISFFAKKARGLMSAYIIKNKLENVEDIKSFDWAGYEYNEAMSSGKKWVFTRKEAP